MSAYLLVRMRVSDPGAYEEYKALASRSLAKYGGRYLVRGGRTETLEGEEETARLVVVEFESLERAREWYRSPDYQKAIAARRGAAQGQFVAVEGVTQ